MTNKQLQVEYAATDSLVPYAHNPRINDQAVEAVAESIKQFGFKQPIVVDQDRVVIVGHTRLKAAKLLGIETVPVVFANDLTPEQAKAYRLADNKTNELAEWDFELLGLELEELDMDMSAFGFDEFDLTEEEPEAVEDDYEEPEQIEPIVKLGDVWQLGKHRLMCGDSTSETDIETLIGGGVTLDMLLTDPPYGINMDGGFSGSCGFGGKGKPIKRRKYNDDWDKETPPKECFDIAITKTKKAIIFGGNFFTDKLPVGTFWICWDKLNTMPTFGDCELAWTNINRKSVKKYEVEYNGLIGKEKERYHPTQKPIAIMAKILEDFSMEQDKILDLFGGSGSTLIACEQLNRKCYMMELDPHYCDVIIDRWEKFTGKKAIKLS